MWTTLFCRHGEIPPYPFVSSDVSKSRYTTSMVKVLLTSLAKQMELLSTIVRHGGVAESDDGRAHSTAGENHTGLRLLSERGDFLTAPHMSLQDLYQPNCCS